MVASKAGVEQAGSDEFRNAEFNKIFKEGFSFSGFERNCLYLNLGNRKYADISGISGIDSILDSRGPVYADFDNDGDTDMFVPSIQGKAHELFRNNVGAGNRWIRVSLVGTTSGTQAAGAIVRVKTSAGVLTKVASVGAGYLSQHDPRLLFGLGQDTRAEWIEVTWPSGATQRVNNVGMLSTLRITEGQAGAEPVEERRASLPDPVSREVVELRALKIRKGEPLPEILVSTLEGKRGPLAKIAPARGRMLLNVWATWCTPCAREMPELERLRPALARNGVSVVGLSIDTGEAAEVMKLVRGYVKSKGVTYPIVHGGEAAIPRIWSGEEVAVPLSVLVDEKGRVAEIFTGWSRHSIERLERLAAPADR